MYLSQLTLTRSRQALMWVARPYRVHQRLCLAFGDEPSPAPRGDAPPSAPSAPPAGGLAGRVLFRIESNRDRTKILVQSPGPPDWAAAFGDLPVLAEAPQCKRVDWQLGDRQLLAFRLRANPTRRKTCDPAEGGDGRKRRIGITDELEQLAWLARKGEASGFRVLRAQVRQDGLLQDTQTSAAEHRTLSLLSVQFDGILQVADAERLHGALATGIGAAKALGFGLLSLGPVRG
jgi:CRISPR system Cascade subunit CasE